MNETDKMFFILKKGKRFDTHKNVDVVKSMLFYYMIMHHRVFVSTSNEDEYIFQIRPYVKDNNSKWSKIQADQIINMLTKWLFDSPSTYSSDTLSVTCSKISPISSMTAALIFIDTHDFGNTYIEVYRSLRDCFNLWKKKAVQRITNKYDNDLYASLLVKNIENCVDKFLTEFKMYLDFISGKLDDCVGIALPEEKKIKEWFNYRSKNADKLKEEDFPLIAIEYQIILAVRENPFYFHVILKVCQDDKYDDLDIMSVMNFLKKNTTEDDVNFDRNFNKYMIKYCNKIFVN